MEKADHPSTLIKVQSKMTSLNSSLPWKSRVMIALGGFISDSVRRSDFTINRRLMTLVERRVPASPSIPSHDIVVDKSRRLWFRLYLPKASAASTPSPAEDGSPPALLPLVIYFHGGGFAFLSPDAVEYDGFCRRLTRRLPAAVISVHYRRSPEHRCPAPYDDGIDVLRFLEEAAGRDTVDPAIASLLRVADLTRCYLAGDSAGGNIAHHVARRWTGPECDGGKKRVRLVGVIPIQPFFGGEARTDSEIRLKGAPLVNMERTDWLWKAFLPKGSDRDHEATNVFGPNGARLGEGFPPAAVVIGEFDPLQDWQRRYVDGLRERGKEVKVFEYPRAIHAFYLFPEIPLGKQMIEDLKAFIYGEMQEENGNGKC